jgi:hypothetical protein
MIPQFTLVDQLAFLSVVLLCFGAGALFLRRHIWNPFDPLLLALLNVAFNVTIVVVFGTSLASVAYVGLGFVAFLLGVRFGGGRPHYSDSTAAGPLRGPSRSATIALLGTVVLFMAVHTAFLISRVGFGIFGDINPDLVKVTVTQGGMGIFRHFSTAAGLLFIPVLAHAYLVHRMRFVFWAGALWFVSQAIVFRFSKAGFFFLIFDLGILMYFYLRATGRKILSPRFVLVTALAGLVPALIVLAVVSAQYNTTIPQMVLDRLVATGGGNYLYFVQEGADGLRALPLGERLLLFVDNLLSPLRLKEWAPLGYMALLVYNGTGVYMPGFGPNPYLFLDGHFLLGWGGILYCAAVGLAVARVRSLKINVIGFYLMVKLVFTWIVDPGIAFSHMIALLVAAPVFSFIWLMFASRLKKMYVPIRRLEPSRS